jgi:tape measure domain-containing protein
MANNTQDIELRIRATNLSKQTTDKVVQSLEKLTKAQEEQIKAAERGAISAAELEKGYQRIEDAAKALLSQRALTQLFEMQSKTLTELQGKLDAARVAQKAYIDALAPGAERTAKQEKEIAKLARTVAGAEKQLERAQNRLNTTAQRLDAFGVNAGNLTQKQEQMTAGINKANAALERQEAAIEGLDAAMAARRAEQDAAAERARAAAATEALARAERDLAASIQAQRRARQEANEVAAMNRAAEQARADILFTNAQREAEEAIRRKTAALAAQTAALRQAADAAERQMRAAGAAGRGPLPVQQISLAQQLRDIQSPGEAALRSLNGINAALGTLESRVSAIRGPVQNYRQALQEAQQAQQGLVAVAGQIDAYNRQITALRAARAEYASSRAAVASLIAQMRSGAAGDDITTRLARAQSTLKQTAESFNQVRNATRLMQTELRAAGVKTSDLVGAQNQLVGQANRAKSAMDQLTEAFRRNGAAADSAGSRIFNWFGGGAGGRTTLSYMQRLRGEALALGTSFVGLYGAIRVADKTIDAFNTKQTIMTRLTVVTGGNVKAAAEEFKYLQEQTDRIGIVFNKVIPFYTRYAIAAKTAGLTSQEVRYTFENISKAIANLGIPIEDSQGVFRAFEQMLNKNKVQAEELTQQLGDRMPGALKIFAAAAGKSTEEFTKMMELGAVPPELIIKVSKIMAETYGAIGHGSEKLAISQARFQNALDRFLTSTAEGGFIQAHQKFLDRLTELLGSGQADKLATQLSAGLVIAIDILQAVAENIDLVKSAMIAWMGIGFVRWILALPAMIAAVRVEMILLNATFAAGSFINAAAIVNGITVAMGAAGLTGAATRLAPALALVANGLALIARWIPVVGAAVAAYYATSAIVENIDKGIQRDVQRRITASNRALQAAEEAQEAAENAKGTRDEKRLQEQAERMKMLAIKAVKETQAAVAEAKRKDVSLVGLDLGAGRTGKATAEPPDRDPEIQLKALRKSLEAEDKKSQTAMRSARMKSAKEELDERLKIIDEPFEALRKQYRESIKDEAKYQEALAAINKSSMQAQAAEREKFRAEQAQKTQAAGKKHEQLAQEIGTKIAEIEADLAKRAGEADASKPFEERRKARVEAIGHAYDDLFRKVAKANQYQPGAVAAEEAKLRKLLEQRKALEEQNADRDEANRLVDEFNRKQGVLATQIQTIRVQAEMGTKSYEQANVEVNDLITKLGPGIQEAGNAAMTFANNMQAALDPTRFVEIISTVSQGLAKTNVTAQTVSNNLNEAQRVMNNLKAQQAREEDAINLKRKLGMIDADQQVEQLNAVTLKYAGTIQAVAEQLLVLIDIARQAQAMPVEKLNELQASAQEALMTSQAGLQLTQEWAETLTGSVVQNGVKLFDDIAQSMAKVISGQQSISEGFKGMMQAAGQFFAALLRDLAMAIIKTMILKALQNSGIPGVSQAASLALAAGQHNGGITGANRTFTRRVDPVVFAGAERFHDGGLPGIKADEVPAILQKGEEVLTRDDPRHALNGGKGGGGAAGMRFVLVDDRKNVPQAMASSEGEQVTMVHLKNNIATLKQMLR